jgi:orotidine-5'-phosphate decarboxylase
LARTVAGTFLSAAAIVALYFGRDVVMPVAVAVAGAMTGFGLLAALVMTQLAEAARSLANYRPTCTRRSWMCGRSPKAADRSPIVGQDGVARSAQVSLAR